METKSLFKPFPSFFILSWLYSLKAFFLLNKQKIAPKGKQDLCPYGWIVKVIDETRLEGLWWWRLEKFDAEIQPNKDGDSQRERRKDTEEMVVIGEQSEEGVTLIPEQERKSYWMKPALTSGPSSFSGVSQTKSMLEVNVWHTL